MSKSKNELLNNANIFTLNLILSQFLPFITFRLHYTPLSFLTCYSPPPCPLIITTHLPTPHHHLPATPHHPPAHSSASNCPLFTIHLPTLHHPPAHSSQPTCPFLTTYLPTSPHHPPAHSSSLPPYPPPPAGPGRSRMPPAVTCHP